MSCHQLEKWRVLNSACSARPSGSCFARNNIFIVVYCLFSNIYWHFFFFAGVALFSQSPGLLWVLHFWKPNLKKCHFFKLNQHDSTYPCWFYHCDHPSTGSVYHALQRVWWSGQQCHPRNSGNASHRTGANRFAAHSYCKVCKLIIYVCLYQYYILHFSQDEESHLSLLFTFWGCFACINLPFSDRKSILMM